MSNVLRVNRKATDGDIVRLNACGFSLKTIGQMLGIHPTTVTIRLHALGVPPADTRRSFMEAVFAGLDSAQQEWLADHLNAGVSVKDYITKLVINAHGQQQQSAGNTQLVSDSEAESDAA